MNITVAKSLNKAGVLALLATTVIATPYALAISAGSSIEEVNSIISDGLPDVQYPANSVPSVPDGGNYKYEYSHTKDGISIDASASYGFSSDWSEHVNTSSETVTVMDVTAGIDGGISLGCDGLNFGAEAMFQFDTDDLVDSLENYMKTKFATEALAMVYSTPLISTVMDGIKSMNNFVTEFSQASCSMNDVKSRSSEIRKSRYEECVADLTNAGTGQSQKSIEEECGPSKLTKKIREFQCLAKNKHSTTKSLKNILDIPYGAKEGESHNPLEWTAGKWTSMFMPDIKFKTNGGKEETEETPAQRPLDEVYDRAFTDTINTIQGIYSDTLESFTEEQIISDTVKTNAIDQIQRYKDLIMMYGNHEIFADDSSNNTEKLSSSKVNTIEINFNKRNDIVYNTIKSRTNQDDFTVGPEDGPTNSMNATDTNLIGDARDMIMYAGKDCFAKVTTTGSKYKWMKAHRNPDSIIALKDLNKEGESNSADASIRRVARCKAIDNLKLDTLHQFYQYDKMLATSYIEVTAKKAAFEATQLITKSLNSILENAAKNSKSLLQSRCQDQGIAAINAKNPPPVDGTCGQSGNSPAYTDCADYAEKNSLTDDKVKSIEMSIAGHKETLEFLKSQYETAEYDFQYKFELYKTFRD